MSELQNRFETAAEEVQRLRKRPDNNAMLRLYALYKQSTLGDVRGERPGGLEFIERAKFDAWTTVKGMGQDEAMQAYIDFVEQLKQKLG